MSTRPASLPLSDAEEAEIQREIADDPETWEASDTELAAARPFADVFPDLAALIDRDAPAKAS